MLLILCFRKIYLHYVENGLERKARVAMDDQLRGHCGAPGKRPQWPEQVGGFQDTGESRYEELSKVEITELYDSLSIRDEVKGRCVGTTSHLQGDATMHQVQMESDILASPCGLGTISSHDLVNAMMSWHCGTSPGHTRQSSSC